MAKQVITDAEDEAQAKAVASQEVEGDNDLASLMKTVWGRRWLHGMIFDVCHAEHVSLIPENPVGTGFNEGARSVGLTLLREVKAQNYRMYIRMLEENDDDNNG